MGKRSSPYADTTERKLTDDGLANSSARLLPPFSVILSSRAPIGHLVINTKPMATNQGCKGLVPRKALDHKFLFYYLGSIIGLLNDLGTGATFKELSGGKLKEVSIPFPALSEQRRIVAILDEAFAGLDAMRANAEKNLQNARELFDRALQSAIEGKLTEKLTDVSRADRAARVATVREASRIDASEIPFTIPNSWRWCRFGSVVEFLNGDRGKNYPNKSEYVSSGLPWINTGHINPDGSLSSSSMNFISRKKFESLGGGKIKPGDLVYCLRGATIGKTAFVEPYTEGAVASSLVIIRPGPAIDRNFAYYFLTSRLGRELIKRFDNGTAQPNLAAGSVAKYVTPLPPLAEQKAIVQMLDSIAGDCQTLQEVYRQKLAAIAELKQSILQKGFSGQLTSAETIAA